MKLLPLSMTLLASIAMASSATQSDWSGGPGFLGPVSTWDDYFWLTGGIDWFDTGQVGILPAFESTEYLVDGAAGDVSICYPGDIDGDGDQDILRSSSLGAEVVWWENADGLGTSWTEHLIDGEIPGAWVCLSDVDGDGDEDVFGASYLSNDVVWWENEEGSGTIWTKHVIDEDALGATSICSDDMDQDGDIDAIAVATDEDAVFWWENEDGLGGSWTRHTVDASCLDPYDVDSDDIDGDGDRDIFAPAYDAGEIAWWENEDGIGTSWTKHPVGGSFDGAICVTSGDIDGDGDSDILGGAYLADAVIWWENLDGAGIAWAGHTIASDCDGACALSVDDMDGDGDQDVIGAAFDAGSVTWWENADGTGTAWIDHSIDDAFDGAGSVESCDPDGDSDKEILASAHFGQIVSWWDLTSYYPSSATLESSILYTGCDPDWGTLLWSTQTPPGTSVSFQIRASDDYTQMGAWSDTLTAPGSLHGLLSDNSSYVQYRPIFETANPDTTPTVLDVTVTWDPLGTGGTGPSGTCLLSVTPNPSGPCPSIGFSLAEEGITEISVYDLSGRLVREFGTAEYPAGNHTIQLQGLVEGVYFVRLRAGEFMATQRFAVVE